MKVNARRRKVVIESLTIILMMRSTVTRLAQTGVSPFAQVMEEPIKTDVCFDKPSVKIQA